MPRQVKFCQTDGCKNPAKRGRMFCDECTEKLRQRSMPSATQVKAMFKATDRAEETRENRQPRRPLGPGYLDAGQVARLAYHIQEAIRDHPYSAEEPITDQPDDWERDLIDRVNGDDDIGVNYQLIQSGASGTMLDHLIDYFCKAFEASTKRANQARTAKLPPSVCECDLRKRQWDPSIGRCLTCGRRIPDPPAASENSDDSWQTYKTLRRGHNDFLDLNHGDKP